MKHHKPSGLNDRCLLSLSFRSQNSMIKALQDQECSEGKRKGLFRSLSKPLVAPARGGITPVFT